MITNGGSTSYIYDAENRLIWTSGYRYVYDGDGDRAEKCVAATSTTPCPTSGTNGTLYWRGRGSDTLDETDLSGNVVEEYIYFNGQRVARREVSSGGTTIAVHYYFSDHLGSHGVVENATASACEQDVDYYPYGGEENDYCSTQVAQHYKFTGKERDTESGLDNFGARYEASSLGRFMTPDWAAKPATVPYAKFGDPQTLNLYAYTENGPVNKADADGHKMAVPEGEGTSLSLIPMLAGWDQSFSAQPYAPYQTTQPAQETTTAQNKPPTQELGGPPPTPDPAGVRTTPAPASNSDSSKSSGSPTGPVVVVAAAGLAPQANGAAVAAKAAAESVGQTLKSGEVLRGVASEAPNITAKRTLTEIAEKALAEGVAALARIVGGGASVIAPMPSILLQQRGPHQYDPATDP